MPLKFKWETEFKETEIGEVPRDWEVRKLKDICEVNKFPKGKKGQKTNFIAMEDIPTDGIYPSYTTKNIENIKSGIEVSQNTILLAKITPSFEHGKMCIVPNINEVRWFATTEVFSLVPKGQNSLFFFFYLLKHPILREPLEWSMSGTSGRQRVQLSALKTLPIPLPPPPEQFRIATVLSWFDDLIENKKRQNEILEKTAMAIFKSWFVDFEPFKDEEFVYNEELGKEIPKGWEVKPIGEVAEFYKGISYKGSEKFYYKTGSEKELVFITLDNILRGGGFKINYTWIISERIKKHQLLRERDLIIANTDMTQEAKVIGSPAIVTFPIDYYKEYGVYSHHITKIIPRDEIYRFYLYVFLKLTQDENTTFSTGTNVLGLDIAHIPHFKTSRIIF